MKDLLILNRRNHTILERLNPYNNDKLTNFSNKDLNDFISILLHYYLEYRKEINLTKEVTFGAEIEFENVISRNTINRDFDSLFLSLGYNMKNDGSLKDGKEITTPILTDNIDTWKLFQKVCNFADKKGSIGQSAGGHIHIGSNIFNKNIKYFKNLLLLWAAYENVITRFSFGDFEYYRPSAEEYAKTIKNRVLKNLEEINDSEYNLEELVIKFGDDRYYNLNFTNFYDQYYDIKPRLETIEVRSPNGSVNPIVWQNNINFFTKLLLYVCNDNFNTSKILERLEKNKKIKNNLYYYIDLESTIELLDLIFNNNIDKIYFLRQYLKDLQPRTEYIKSKQYTL